jgi:hypothetical protein
VPVVVHLGGAVDPQHGLERDVLAPGRRAVTRTRWPGSIPPATPETSKVSVPSSPRVAADSPGAYSNGRMPSPTRLLRWIRSKLSAITARTPRSAGPLAAQSREEPLPYSLPANTTSGTPSCW